jgi:hypothetical protein
MKRTTKYINQFKPPKPTHNQISQPNLFDTDAEQIKEYHLKKLHQLKQEAKARSDEWIRKQRLTMLGEMK